MVFSPRLAKISLSFSPRLAQDEAIYANMILWTMVIIETCCPGYFLKC